jgi:hypothetical protein
MLMESGVTVQVGGSLLLLECGETPADVNATKPRSTAADAHTAR